MIRQKLLKQVRIIFSIIFMSGFIIAFSDVRAKLPSTFTSFLTYFQFWPSLQKFSFVPGVLATGFIVFILITLIAGRVYCSTVCPLGITQDVLGYIMNKLKKSKSRFKKPLNYIRYTILVFLIISIFYSGIFLISLLDPFANFGRILSTIYQPVLIFANNQVSRALMFIGIYNIQPLPYKEFYKLPFLIGLTILLTLIVMVYSRGRLYCNTICPVGAFLGLISKFSLLKIKISQEHCTQCGKCQNVCKANCINIKNMTVDDSRCVACYNCVSSCEDSSIGYENVYKNYRRPKENYDINKRNFLKSGILYLATFPVLAQVSNVIAADSDKSGILHDDKRNRHQGRYRTRGPISPPGSGGEDRLKANCIGCQLCISTCPTKVLQPAFLEYGITGLMLPRMNNDVGFCNYECTKCGEVCPAGAILRLSKEEKKVTQIGTVVFEMNHCVVFNLEKSCGSCSEHCPTQAVHMVPYKGFLTIPQTNSDICIGCGACEHVCPVTDPHPAIYVVPNKIHKIARKPTKEKLINQTTNQDFPF